MEGYPNAAANFSKEANLQPQQEDSSIRARQQIQHDIHKGEIQNAIDALNDMDPDVRTLRKAFPSPQSTDTTIRPSL
jgi:glucose-induced degradation protein 8